MLALSVGKMPHAAGRGTLRGSSRGKNNGPFSLSAHGFKLREEDRVFAAREGESC